MAKTRKAPMKAKKIRPARSPSKRTSPEGIEPRRQPLQARAKETVDKILEAAANVVEKHGFEAATTNHIAREAGLSVGSVYQYYRSKEEIVFDLWQREVQRDYGQATEEFAATKDLPLEEFFRVSFDQHFCRFGNRPALKAELMRVIPKFAKASSIVDVRNLFRQLMLGVLEMRKDEIQSDNLELTAEVLVNALMGNIQNAMTEDPAKLREPRFNRELVRLCLGYLRFKT